MACSTPIVLDDVVFLFFKPTSKIPACTILFWETLGLFPLNLFSRTPSGYLEEHLINSHVGIIIAFTLRILSSAVFLT